MSGETPQASGVQELIARIRDDGMRAGQEEADRILAEAKRTAAEITAAATRDAEKMRRAAEEKAQSVKSAALAALQLAARDAKLQLEGAVMAAFERHVRRLLEPTTHDPAFIRTLVLTLAGQVADAVGEDAELEVLVAEALADPGEASEAFDARVRQAVLGISGDMLREGVELIPSSDVPGGVRVRVVDDALEIDLTDDAVSALLMKHMLPRYRAILEGKS